MKFDFGLKTLSCAVLLTCGMAAQADTTSDNAATAEAAPVERSAAEKKRRSKLVCKREKVTGSRVRQKICRTVGQIEDRAERDRTDVDLMTRNARPGNLGG